MPPQLGVNPFSRLAGVLLASADLSTANSARLNCAGGEAISLGQRESCSDGARGEEKRAKRGKEAEPEERKERGEKRERAKKRRRTRMDNPRTLEAKFDL